MGKGAIVRMGCSHILPNSVDPIENILREGSVGRSDSMGCVVTDLSVEPFRESSAFGLA